VPSDKPPVVEVRNLSWNDALNNISLSAAPARWLALAASTVRASASSCWRFSGPEGRVGEVLIDGERCRITSPHAAKDVRYGMALIPGIGRPRG